MFLRYKDSKQELVDEEAPEEAQPLLNEVSREAIDDTEIDIEAANQTKNELTLEEIESFYEALSSIIPPDQGNNLEEKNEITKEFDQGLPCQKNILRELKNSILLLEKAKKTNQVRTCSYRFNSCMTILAVCACLGEPIMVAALFIMITHSLHAKLLPGLQRKLAEAQNSLHENKETLTRLKQKYHAVSEKLDHEGWQNTLENKIDPLVAKWWDGYEEGKNNCIEWMSSNGEYHSLYKDFPGFQEEDYCWFQENYKTHPLDYCNALASQMCEIAKPFEPLLHQQNQLFDAIRTEQQIIKKMTDEVSDLQSKIDDDKPGSIGLGVFAIILCLAITCTIYFVRRWQITRKLHNKEMERETLVEYSLTDPNERERIINLAKHLAIKDDVLKMKINDLLSLFKFEAKKRMTSIAFLTINQSKSPHMHRFFEADGKKISKKIIDQVLAEGYPVTKKKSKK